MARVFFPTRPMEPGSYAVWGRVGVIPSLDKADANIVATAPQAFQDAVRFKDHNFNKVFPVQFARCGWLGQLS
eukprot:842799-Rhodomonas_salina.3